jgi:hypothetical protein
VFADEGANVGTKDGRAVGLFVGDEMGAGVDRGVGTTVGDLGVNVGEFVVSFPQKHNRLCAPLVPQEPLAGL